jgi:hypothetical protein
MMLPWMAAARSSIDILDGRCFVQDGGGRRAAWLSPKKKKSDILSRHSAGDTTPSFEGSPD